MKELITEEDLMSVTRLNKKRLDVVGKALMKITGLKKVNELYSQLNGEGIDFVNHLFETLNISIDFDESELKNIPQSGGFFTVSNHPFGALDGLVLIKLIHEKRPDFRVLANFLLSNIDELSEFFVPVNPFDILKEKSSIGGLKEAIRHLDMGAGLGLFPAGEVSTYQTNSRKVTDKEWNLGMIKLMHRSNLPVVPIYFSGGNSLFFHLVGILNPNLRTAQLPKEMLRKKDSRLKVRIGSPVSPRQIKDFETPEQFGRFLRAKTFSLASAIEVKRFFLPRFTKKEKEKEVIPPVDQSLIEQELGHLEPEQKLTSQQEFDVFLAYSNEIPNTLREIGRLREITFRKVGEGTNRSIDVDEYDLYYHHLVLWDRENKEIAGGYRIGKGDDISIKYGMNGFYVSSLFRFSEEMRPILRQTIELGRSFVREEYQVKRLPLFLLWKGIMQFLIGNPEYRYIIGPVSISNDYSRISKKIMVQFIKKHYYDHEMAQYVKPSKRFKAVIKDEELKGLVDMSDNNLKNLDKIIGDIEPMHSTMPILLKKYISQNARIIGFNVDPKFNDALDGLMILDMQNLPEESVQNLRDDLNRSMN